MFVWEGPLQSHRQQSPAALDCLWPSALDWSFGKAIDGLWPKMPFFPWDGEMVIETCLASRSQEGWSELCSSGEKKPRGIRKVTQPPDVAKSHMWESAQKGNADH